jgi:hypothetical protein
MPNVNEQVEAPPQEVISTTPCPSCLAAGKLNMLKNRAGRFETYCDANHKWPDSEDLRAAVEAAKKKHPDKFPAAATPTEAEPTQFFTVDRTTKLLLEQLTGQTINGASELKGIVWGLVTEAKDAREEANKAKTQAIATAMKFQKTQPGVPVPVVAGEGQFTLSVPECYMESVIEQANYEQKDVQQYLQEQLSSYLESFFTVNPPRG